MGIGNAFAFGNGIGENKNFKKHIKSLFAFTLAEVLVTMGIIGVVSAMTVPSLASNWQKRAYVTQLHKAYSDIQRAFVTQMNEKQATNLMEAGFYSIGYPSDFMLSKFKVVKNCGISKTPCFASSYRILNGSSYGLSSSCHAIVTGSGVAICMYTVNNVTLDDENTTHLGRVYVDINGPKGPNIMGRDLFLMYYYPDGSLDSIHVPINCRKFGSNCGYGSSPRDTRQQYYNTYCRTSVTDLGGCFGKILNDNWEMKY